MDLNRRSVLLGLGTAAATVGGAFASGAFSSVEATRTVNLNTADDTNALLSFQANSPAGDNIIATEDESGSSVIKIEQTDLNENATTTFTGALAVGNSGGKDVGLSVNPTASDDPNGLIGDVLDIEDTNGNSIVDGGTEGDNAIDLAAGGSVNLSVVVDLRSTNTGAAIDQIDSIVFAARESDHSNP